MDRAGARDLIYGFIGDQYTTISTSVLSEAGQIRYGDVVVQSPVANDAYWIRINMQVVLEEQETLRNGVRRFLTSGLIIVQVFAPITDVNALVNIDSIADQLRDALRIYQGNEMEFTSARISDNMPAEPNWLRANVISNYAYRQFL